MSGFHEGLSPDLVITKLDKVFFSAFNAKVGPQMADFDQNDVFIQDKTKLSAVATEIMADAGMWDERGLNEDVAEGTIKNDDARSFTVVNYAQALKISKNLFDDEQWGAVKRMVKKLGRKGMLTKRNNAFGIYRNAFGTTLTNDGAALISDSHSNQNGDTIDNKFTAAASPSTVKSLINNLQEQKDEAGDIVGHDGVTLLCSNRLFDDLVEITESTLKADTTDNNVNAFSIKYNLTIKQSNYISAAAGGSDTAFFLLGNDHSVFRWKRQDIITDWVDYKFDDKNRYTYKGEFREVYGAISYS